MLVTFPIIYRETGADAFGVWAVISGFAAMLALSEGGIRSEGVRRVAAALGRDSMEDARDAYRQALTLLTAIGAGVMCVSFVATPLLCQLILPAEDLTSTVVAVATFQFLSAGAALVVNGLWILVAGLQRTDLEQSWTIVAVIAGTGATVSLATLDCGLWALLAGSLTPLPILTAGALVSTGRVASISAVRIVRLPWSAARSLFGMSVLLMAMQVSNFVDYEWDKIILSRLVGSAESGFYDIGTTLTTHARNLVLLPAALLLAALAELLHRDLSRAWILHGVVDRLTLGLGMLTLGPLIALSPAFTRLWLGEGSDGDIAVATQLLAVAALVALPAASSTFMLIAQGRHKWVAAIAVTKSCVNAVCSFVLVLAFGLVGALIGSIVASSVAVVLCLNLTRRCDPQGTLLKLRSYFALGLSCAVMFVLGKVSEPTAWIPLILMVIACIVSGAAIHLVVGAVTIKELNQARWIVLRRASQ